MLGQAEQEKRDTARASGHCEAGIAKSREEPHTQLSPRTLLSSGATRGAGELGWKLLQGSVRSPAVWVTQKTRSVDRGCSRRNVLVPTAAHHAAAGKRGGGSTALRMLRPNVGRRQGKHEDRKHGGEAARRMPSHTQRPWKSQQRVAQQHRAAEGGRRHPSSATFRSF